MGDTQLEARLDACLCDPALTARHEPGDTVTFRDPSTIAFRELATAERAVAIWRQLEGISDNAEILARLSEYYLTHFIVKWSLRDGKGKPIAVSPVNVKARVIDAAPFVALDLADIADDLYREAVFGPLVLRAARSLPPGQITEQTSAGRQTSSNGRKRANGRNGKQSAPSLISTTPMGATEATP